MKLPRTKKIQVLKMKTNENKWNWTVKKTTKQHCAKLWTQPDNPATDDNDDGDAPHNRELAMGPKSTQLLMVWHSFMGAGQTMGDTVRDPWRTIGDLLLSLFCRSINKLYTAGTFSNKIHQQVHYNVSPCAGTSVTVEKPFKKLLFPTFQHFHSFQ